MEFLANKMPTQSERQPRIKLPHSFTTNQQMTNTALIIIDAQQAFRDPAMGARNNPAAEANIARLLAHWRQEGEPVIHVFHSSLEAGSLLRAGQPGHAFLPEAQPLPNELCLEKSINSAFIGTRLAEHLEAKGIANLVMAGFTTDHCVSTSVRMGANLGFNVTLVSDATATYARVGEDGKEYSADIVHNVSLASLQDEFCRVRRTLEITREFRLT